MYLHLKMSIPFNITAVICKSEDASRERIKRQNRKEDPLLLQVGSEQGSAKGVAEEKGPTGERWTIAGGRVSTLVCYVTETHI